MTNNHKTRILIHTKTIMQHQQELIIEKKSPISNKHNNSNMNYLKKKKNENPKEEATLSFLAKASNNIL